MNSTIYDCIKATPDVMEGYMLIEHSVMVLNSWCREQNIKPSYFVALIQALMLGKGQRKMGIYLQGNEDSGHEKLFSQSTFACAGIIGNGWETLKDKQMILGKDISINELNVEQYKSLLLSKPLVVINSIDNRELTLPYSDEDKMMKARFYFFEELNDSDAIKSCYGHLHPKMFTTQEFTDDEYDLALQQQMDMFSDDAINHNVPFKTVWVPNDWSNDRLDLYYKLNEIW